MQVAIGWVVGTTCADFTGAASGCQSSSKNQSSMVIMPAGSTATFQASDSNKISRSLGRLTWYA